MDPVKTALSNQDAQRTPDGKPRINPEVVKFMQDVKALMERLTRLRKMVLQKRSAGADDALKAQVALTLTSESKPVDQMLSQLYSRLRQFEDDRTIGMDMREIRKYKDTLDSLDRMKRNVFSDIHGKGASQFRTGAIRITRTGETDQTRKMTTTQVVDDTDRQIADHSRTLEQMKEKVITVGKIQEQIGDQLVESIQHLTDIGDDMDHVNDKIVTRTKQIEKVRKKSKKSHTCLFAIINIALFALFIALLVISFRVFD
eukprot:gnl/Chilomastix_cuspidata/1928.p1 GENE.gnl/Chilomastix_cuspidata/1928~~gnl/Chilomastix_cuspidata/1928.p1  ORF type:complete len:258 (-),score=116.61 gnl/Chilomastix_cuspidata/1928:57-830(-)